MISSVICNKFGVQIRKKDKWKNKKQKTKNKKQKDNFCNSWQKEINLSVMKLGERKVLYDLTTEPRDHEKMNIDLCPHERAYLIGAFVHHLIMKKTNRKVSYKPLS